MIDDGLGFQLLGAGARAEVGSADVRYIDPGGGIDWNFQRKRGLGL
jgi:hypothetical protein